MSAATIMRGAIAFLMSKIDEDGLPMPHSLDLNPSVQYEIDVNWMLEEQPVGTRAVVKAFPGHWEVSGHSTSREPIMTTKVPIRVDDVEVLLDITVWGAPDAIKFQPVLD